jgi:3',5'-cyclic AMP phosphodiesterase CpdA
VDPGPVRAHTLGAVRIAHLSDLHLLSLEGAVPFRLFNKRITGYLNLRFHRKAVHKPGFIRAAAREIQRLGVDHVAITGDLSNLALEGEFTRVLRFLEEDLGLPPSQVSLVPGNHDAYTRGAHKKRRFATTFDRFLRSDLPELTAPGEVFPFVHLRGPAAIIGLSTALPRLPLVASGALGRAQLDALARVLEHPEVQRRTPVLLQHHPIHNPQSLVKRALEGLHDASDEAHLLRKVARGLILHGHLHRRVHQRLQTDAGYIDAVGATSASLLHDSDERMAGFNVYEVSADGAIASIESHRLELSDESFRAVAVPRSAW